MKKNILIILAVLVFVLIVVRVLTASKPATPAAKPLSAKSPAADLLVQAVKLEDTNEIVQARDTYKKILMDYPDFRSIEDVQKRLDDVNMKILLSRIETPQTIIHVVEPGDSLAKIAKKHGVTIGLIKKSNGLVSDTIRVGQRLRIWKGVLSVFVDKSQNILILKSDDEIMKIYRVSTGANNSTPVGVFTIEGKLINPVWFKSGAVIPAGSPENALGSRWMGFDLAGYGIHGTIEPETIGQQVTAGCIRLSNEDVEELYDLLPAGTKVTVVD